MDWSAIGETLLGQGLPLLGGALLGPAGAAGGRLVASALGVAGDDPAAVQAELQGNPDAVLTLKQLELEHATELRRLALESESNRLAQETTRQAEVNATMRAELSAASGYRAGWRPTIGYVVAFQLGLLGLAVFIAVCGAVYAAFDGRADVVQVLMEGLATLLASLTAILSVELAVLGVNIVKRSDDKAVAKGRQPAPGLIAAMAQRIAGKPS